MPLLVERQLFSLYIIKQTWSVVLTAKTRLKTKRIYLIKFIPQVSIFRLLKFFVVFKNYTVSPDGYVYTGN